jgi:hypothetical protein
MKVKFTLSDTKPFSINKFYYKRSKTRTTQARKWGDDICKLLSGKEVQSAIEVCRSNFNPLIHHLEVSYNFHIPTDRFYTKEGKISRRSMDLTNIEKPLQDILFCGRFYERGVLNFNIDDQYITTLTSRKMASNTGKYFIEVEVEILPLPHLQ